MINPLDEPIYGGVSPLLVNRVAPSCAVGCMAGEHCFRTRWRRPPGRRLEAKCAYLWFDVDSTRWVSGLTGVNCVLTRCAGSNRRRLPLGADKLLQGRTSGGARVNECVIIHRSIHPILAGATDLSSTLNVGRSQLRLIFMVMKTAPAGAPSGHMR